MKEFWKVFIRDEKSFHLLSKVGKGPDAQRGFGPEGWGLESFTEFKGQGAGVFLSILIHNCIRSILLGKVFIARSCLTLCNPMD